MTGSASHGHPDWRFEPGTYNFQIGYWWESDPDRFGSIIIGYISFSGRFKYLGPEILELDSKIRKIPKNTKNIRRTAKYSKNIQKFTQNQKPKTKKYPNTRTIFSENLKFSPKIRTRNLKNI